MIARPNSARQLAARLGLFAVLFQAVLFGWHHHELNFAGRLPAPIVENQSTTPQLADDEDGCEICQVLHHLTAAPVDVVAALPPIPVTAVPPPSEAAFIARSLELAFQARAPPRFDAAIG
jgi:hypothetical protein